MSGWKEKKQRGRQKIELLFHREAPKVSDSSHPAMSDEAQVNVLRVAKKPLYAGFALTLTECHPDNRECEQEQVVRRKHAQRPAQPESRHFALGGRCAALNRIAASHQNTDDEITAQDKKHG